MAAAALPARRREGRPAGLAAVTRVPLAPVRAGFLRPRPGSCVVVLSGNVLRKGRLLGNRSWSSRGLKLAAPGRL